MKQFFAAAFCVAFAALATAQDITLDISGPGIKKIKIDKIIVVQEDATVATSFPFTISVSKPNPKALYYWTAPAGVVGIKKAGGKFEVSGAPKGAVVIGVEEIGPDLDKDGRFIGFISKLAEYKVNVGDVPGPTPPDPPTTDTPFVKSLKTAFAKELPAEMVKLPTLIDIYRNAAKSAKDTRLVTLSELKNVMKAARVAQMGESLAQTRSVTNAYTASKLPQADNTPLDDDVRELCAKTFTEIADALSTIK